MDNTLTETFGEVIYSYSRAQAIEDGVLIDMMQEEFREISRSHYKFPIAITAAVFAIMEKAVTNPRCSNDYKGVWHDMLWMSRVMKRKVDESTILFRVKIKGTGHKSLFDFKMVCGPGDNAKPVMTIMLPNED